MWLLCGCASSSIKLLRKPDTESQNFNFCMLDLYFLSTMIKSTMTAQPTDDSEEEVLKKKQLYGPFLWMGFNCLKASATLRRQFTFYH